MSKCCFVVSTTLFSVYLVLSLAILTFTSTILGNDVFSDGGDKGENDSDGNPPPFKKAMAIITLVASAIFTGLVALALFFQTKLYNKESSPSSWQGLPVPIDIAVAVGMVVVGAIAVTFSAAFAPEEDDEGEEEEAAPLSWIYYTLVAVSVAAICLPIACGAVVVIKGEAICPQQDHSLLNKYF